MNDQDPDLSDIVQALGAIEDALSTGYAVNRPSSEGREQRKSVTADGEWRGLAVLKERALSCAACVLSASRNKVVFGEGASSPAVLVVGEGPGAEEDSQGLPFVGASGKLLDKMLSSIGLSRDKNCYIANVVKCRPPNNREPAPWMNGRPACHFLREQIQPPLSQSHPLRRKNRCPGSPRYDRRHQSPSRQERTSTKAFPLVATFHPSALLRDETLKRPAWEDLKRLRDRDPRWTIAHSHGRYYAAHRR